MIHIVLHVNVYDTLIIFFCFNEDLILFVHLTS